MVARTYALAPSSSRAIRIISRQVVITLRTSAQLSRRTISMPCAAPARAGTAASRRQRRPARRALCTEPCGAVKDLMLYRLHRAPACLNAPWRPSCPTCRARSTPGPRSASC